MSAPAFPIEIEEHAGFSIVRDDRVPGGTKARVLGQLYEQWPEEEFVFGGPALGYAQVAMGWAARWSGKRSTYFVARRAELHPRTQMAIDAGAKIIQVDAGRMSVVQARARGYAEMIGARFLPLGFDVPEFGAAMAEVARFAAHFIDPPEIWTAAGTGALARALQAGFPKAAHHAVAIGFPPDVGDAKLWHAPERFDQDAEFPPPFPSCSNYDAKAWRFMLRHAQPGALFWNVAG